MVKAEFRQIAAESRSPDAGCKPALPARHSGASRSVEEEGAVAMYERRSFSSWAARDLHEKDGFRLAPE